MLLVAGFALVVLGPLASWLMLVTFPEFAGSASAARSWSFVAVTAVLVGLFVIARVIASVVLISKLGLVQRTITFRISHLAWRNVTSVEYLSIRGAIRICGKRAQITVGLASSGLAQFLDTVETTLASEETYRALTKTRQVLQKLERTDLF
jgi:hypothetical protein